jgi:hypothetical protein
MLHLVFHASSLKARPSVHERNSSNEIRKPALTLKSRRSIPSPEDFMCKNSIKKSGKLMDLRCGHIHQPPAGHLNSTGADGFPVWSHPSAATRKSKEI